MFLVPNSNGRFIVINVRRHFVGPLGQLMENSMQPHNDGKKSWNHKIENHKLRTTQ